MIKNIMKTKRDILKSEPVFLGNWSSKFEVIADFSDTTITEEEYLAKVCPPNRDDTWWLRDKSEMKTALQLYKKVKILFAHYDVDGYEGSAWVLYCEGGKLFEVHGSHCSCYGLEGQWERGEAVNLKELKHRIEQGTFGKYEGFQEQLREFLGL